MIKQKFKRNLVTNPILKSDSYKYSHFLQLKKKTNLISSYIEARSYPDDRPNYVVVAGNQMYMIEYLTEPFVMEHIDDAELFCEMHGEPFNREGYEYILEKYNGYWPVEIEAVSEGTVLPTGNVVLQINNEDDKCAWVTSWLETQLLRGTWPTSNVATLTANIRELIEDYIEVTSDDPDQLPFKLHGFGARGVSGGDGARTEVGAMIPFMGSDTVEAIAAAIQYYDSTDMPAFSIPAAEHATITPWGRMFEADAYENIIDAFGDKYHHYAIVSDSYNIFNAINNIYGTKLKEKILNSKGTLVVRPDSGYPPDVVLKCIEALGDHFGYTMNSKGYKVLNPKVRVIQGDGIDYDMIKEILRLLAVNKWAIDNIAFGMGGAMLQHHNRDTYGWAMKCSYTEVDGIGIDVYKDPITDSGKKSKKGIQALIKEDGVFKTIRKEDLNGRKNYLVVVYSGCKIVKYYTMDEVRANFVATFRK